MKAFVASLCIGALAVLLSSAPALAQEKQKPPEPVPLPEEAPQLLSPEQEEVALAFLAEIAPEQLEYLKQLRIVNPAQYKLELMRALRELTRMNRVKKEEPEIYDRMIKIRKMEEESRTLGRKYRDADASRKKEIESDLRQLLSRLFDLREQDRREEVARLEKRLKELKESLAARSEHKREIIEERLARLTGKKKYLEWD